MIVVTHKIKMGLIKDPANSILTQRAMPPSTAIFIHFKGPCILVEPIKMWDVTTYIDMGKYRVEPQISTTGEEATTTYSPALSLTFKSVGIANMPPHPIVIGLIGVPCELL